MKKNRILAIFDFCDTLIGTQTGDRFIMLLGRSNKYIKYIPNELSRSLLLKLRLLPPGLRHKKFQLKQLHGLSKESVIQTAQKYLHSVLIPEENIIIRKKMQWHKSQGHTVVIVSGGFTVYIQEYANHYGVPYVIATDLEVVENKYTGNIEGLDCMGLNKLIKINAAINLEEFDLDRSYSYSDSPSDIPLLTLTGNPCFIDTGIDTEWVDILGWEKIKL